jgi:transcriptional regulator with XRE-family HTH domain
MKITGSAIVKRIDTLLKEKGETRKVFVSIGAIKDTQSVTNWLQRGTIPAADVALAIADYFNVSVRWLLTGKNDAELTRDERNLVTKYGCLSDDNQRNVKALIDSMLEAPVAGKKAASA